MLSSLRRLLRLSGFTTLDSREKKVLLGGLLFVGAFLLVQLLVMPFVEARSALEQSILRREAELSDMKRLRQEYLALKEEEGGIEAGVDRRQPDFSLFTFLDRQAEKSRVKRQISSMKPSRSEGEGNLAEVMVEVNLQQVGLAGLVDFLLLLESSEKVVFVRRITIQGRDSGLLDVTLQVVTFTRKG